jgi:hypothetical protein
MLTKELFRTLTGYLLAFMFAALVAGCGGGSDGGATGSTPRAVAYLTARTDSIVAVRVGEVAILDGSKSIGPSSAPLSFSWSFASKPDASMAQLQNPTTENPSFVPDVRGAYTVQLVVSAGGLSSQRDIQLVVVTLDPERLTGPFLHPGLSSNCVQCHNGELDIDPLDPGRGKIPGKSPDHLATSNLCETCHTPMGFTMVSPSLDASGNPVTLPGGSPVGPFVTAFIDHQEVWGDCSECHNGVLAVGKSEFHIPTVAECDNCHNTTSFLELALDGSFDHTGISSGCSVCHNGTVATGMTDTAIHQTTESDCVFCHLPYSPPTTVDFTGAYPDHTGPEVLGAGITCDSCHNGTIATGKIDTPNPPHISTSLDCSACHNTTNFANAFVDHTGPAVMGAGITCDSCHDGIAATGKPTIGHLTTLDDCDVCHTPGGTFAGGIFDHVAAGVIDNCASCHDGIVATGKDAKVNPAHIPTILDCSSCHDTSNFTSFSGIIFNHQGIDPNNCASCHDTGLATGKTVNHIPAADDCSVCHTSTAFSGATFDHTGITRGCEGCHNGQFSTTTNTLYGKSISHLPTIQDCYICHTTTAFTPSITPFEHVGISGNCTSCHDGSVDNVAAGAIGKTPDHPATTADCGVCHSTTGTFADPVFDHTGRVDNCTECHGDGAVGAVTKKDTGHVFTTQDCSVCHVTGTFAPAVFDHTDIVDNCASCHGVTATGSPNDPIHQPPIEDCSVCHNTTVFAGAKFDHDAAGVVDNCASCHDNNTAIGKATNHVPTIEDCSVCHQTTGFVPGTFDHVGIVDNCASCHDAGLATPKKLNHVATNQDCGVCHNTVGFVPATFDHTGIVNNCASCHDGVTATGMIDATPPHIATSLDCSSCHTTATFVGGTWTHDSSSTGICTTCHDGVTATGQPPTGPLGHFETSAQCDTCHSTQGWAPTNNFSHTTPEYPGDHNSNVVCITCHTNNSEIIQSYRNSIYTGFCAACHANDYEPGPHKWYENPETKYYTVSQLKNCADSCHVYTDSSESTRTRTRNSEHHEVNDRDF